MCGYLPLSCLKLVGKKHNPEQLSCLLGVDNDNYTSTFPKTLSHGVSLAANTYF